MRAVNQDSKELGLWYQNMREQNLINQFIGK